MNQQIYVVPVQERCRPSSPLSDRGAGKISRVILGPSLTSWSQTLRERLGDRYLVEDMLFDTAGWSDDQVVVVLGTTEIPVNEMQVYRHRPGAVVLLGIAPCHSGGRGTKSVPPAIDRLVETLSGLGRPIREDAA